MPKAFSCVGLLFMVFSLPARQPPPVELMTAPEEYSFARSGSLIGHIDHEKLDTDTHNGQAAGRLFLDAFLTPRLFTSIRINAVQNKDHELDTNDIANLGFTHNNYKFNLALAYRGKETKAGTHSWFANYSLSSIRPADSLPGRKEVRFTAFKVNVGLKFMWQADWDQNLLVHGSVKLNRLWLEDPPGKAGALERVFGMAVEDQLSRIYNGFGLKTTIQLNNISVFFETQMNFDSGPDDNKRPIPGFVDHTFYSIGFTSNSTAILGKRKQSTKAPSKATNQVKPSE